MKKSPFSVLAFLYSLTFLSPQPHKDILTSVMPSSVQVPLLGVSLLCDLFFDSFYFHSSRQHSNPFPTADVPSISQSSMSHQVDRLRHSLSLFWCPLQGEGEHPCDNVCSVAAVSSVSGAEISWVVHIFILYFLSAMPSFTLHWSPSSVELKIMPGY